MAQPTTSIFLNSTTPSAPSGNQNVVPQSDGGTPQQSVSFYPQVATDSLLGVVQPDGTTITISDGVITAVGGGGGVPAALSDAPDWPPASPTSWDDEFTGASLNTALWTNVIAGASGNTVQVNKSMLGIICPPNSGDNWTAVTQPVPVSPPYAMTAKVALAQWAYDYSYGGLVVLDSSGKAVVFGFYPGAVNYLPNINVQHWNNNTSYNSDQISWWSPGIAPSYLAIEDDGTNLNFLFSTGGSAFYELYSESRTAFLSAPAFIGLYCGSSNGGSYPCVLESDWFRRTA